METKYKNLLEQKLSEDYGNITGIVVMKDGKTQYESYFNGCNSDSKVHIYSVTKSILSILIGIAIDKGYIQSVNEQVLHYFPDYTVKRRETTIQQVTIEHLLTMTAPYKYKSAPYIKYFTSDNWITFTLDLLGGRGKIGDFRYTPLIGPDILCGILVKATGQSVFEFASRNLFTPLGITVKNNLRFHSKEEQIAFNKSSDISGWACDPEGTNPGGWGLSLSPLDMANIGQLYLNRGTWNGSQIVSAEWIDESTREHSRFQDINMPYGYLWWVDSDRNGYAAMGDGGNIIYVNPQNNMVVSIASFFQPNVKDRIDFIKNFIEPAFDTN